VTFLAFVLLELRGRENSFSTKKLDTECTVGLKPHLLATTGAVVPLGAVVEQELLPPLNISEFHFHGMCFGRRRAQGKRRKKFETITEVWKIAASKQRIALRTSSQHMA